MKDMATNRIVLASKSPRRKELLSLLNIPFEIIVSDIDEKIDLNNDIYSEIEKLSFQKAKAVFKKNNDAIVIGADTIVYINKQVLGKPKDKEDARRMLKMLSNNIHEVITGVTIISNKSIDTFSQSAKVYFYPLLDEEIEEYIDSIEPLDKAGAYAIQGLGAKFVKKIDGDYSTVVGLPIGEVYRRLKNFYNADLAQ